MRDRLALACVVLAAAVAGLCFAPVFGVVALLPSISVVAVVTFAAAVLSAPVAAWRPLIGVVAGLLGVVEVLLFPTTVFGLPTGATVAALGVGVTDSWQLALQSTWPARPDAALLLFVPLLVLVASVFGVEVLLRLGKPVLALGPSFLVVVLSQFFGALSGVAAIAAALGYVVVAATLFVVVRSTDENVSAWVLLPAPAAVVAVVAVAGLFVSMPAPVYSFKQDQLVPLALRVASPLDDIAYRRAHPDAPVFKFRPQCASCVPDRWPVVVLDSFDGVNWAPGSKYRRIGTELPAPRVDVSVRRRDAMISLRETGGRWLPSQTWPAAVTGADPLVEESQGTLLVQSTATEYVLSWWEPEAGPLEGAAVDPYVAAGREGVGTPPQGVAELATEATRGVRSSFVAALQLERFLREHYRLAADTDVPGGHSWPQLRRFLLETKEGTSEQFASAYVVLARMLGIPSRLVVGYRTPEPSAGGEYVVHNDDVLVWPEVAVDGVGWVPLDPANAANRGGSKDTGLAAATREARDKLPPPPDLKNPPVADRPVGDGPVEDAGQPFPYGVVLIVVVALVVVWLAGVPLAKWVRAHRRRRRPGGGAVVGAWLEARDRLREHRVPFTVGMTPMEMGYAAVRSGVPSTMDGMRVLATAVDVALWSGREPGAQVREEAWAAVRAVRRGLAARGFVARLRAAVDPRTLVR
ncbi:transglutaminase domain-containing protein [Lentzea aerocolonigenes]|uniref:transglutaminase domain-containing protein n=1 Tax=Lentzea aerocolonigenes TaxID=68170 RepID=UPI000B00D6A8|nr:transglutaminase domain-containing protein [Lentzea aerocolonigenes]